MTDYDKYLHEIIDYGIVALDRRRHRGPYDTEYEELTRLPRGHNILWNEEQDSLFFDTGSEGSTELHFENGTILRIAWRVIKK